MVPGRSPRSWPPPNISGCSGGRSWPRRRVMSAPIPLGPLILCALALIRSMPRVTQRVDVPGKALRRVHVQVGVRLLEPIRDLGDRLPDASFVVDVHDADEHGIRSNGAGDCVRIDDPTAIGGDERDLESPSAQFGERFEHGMMLDGG